MIPVLLQVAATTTFWPNSVAGWIALVMGTLSVLGIAVSHGRNVQTINGLGKRVGVVEETDAKHTESLAQRQQETNRILDQHATMLRLIGEAKGEGVRCREDYTMLNESIGAKLDAIRAETHSGMSAVRERLSGVEAKLEMVLKNGKHI